MRCEEGRKGGGVVGGEVREGRMGGEGKGGGRGEAAHAPTRFFTIMPSATLNTTSRFPTAATSSEPSALNAMSHTTCFSPSTSGKTSCQFKRERIIFTNCCR